MQQTERLSAIKIPENIRVVIDSLERKGFLAYLVGGCVRDSCLGVFPKDWDIATSACPAQIKAAFDKTYDTGIKHGTVTVSVNGERFEVTTFRIDGEYTDSRRPESVTFSSSIEDDLKRRDFTVNAIAYNPKSGFLDPFGGVADISEKLIRGVGVPSERFGEDALRMLRAVRFAACLGFSIEQKTKNAIIENAALIKKISAERIREEIMRLLSAASVKIVFSSEFVSLMENISKPLADSILNEKASLSMLLNHCKPEPLLRFAVLISKIDQKSAEALVSKLKFSKKDSTHILALHKIKDIRLCGHRDNNVTRECVARALCDWGERVFLDYLYMQMLTCVVDDEIHRLPAAELEINADYIRKLDAFYNEITENNFPVFIKDLAINGYDLQMEFELSGKIIGKILEKLLSYVYEYPERNTCEALIKKAHEIIAKKFD